ncbi:MAG: HD domain-containing protein, partial [Thermoleophilaceae bacterium]
MAKVDSSDGAGNGPGAGNSGQKPRRKSRRRRNAEANANGDTNAKAGNANTNAKAGNANANVGNANANVGNANAKAGNAKANVGNAKAGNTNANAGNTTVAANTTTAVADPAFAHEPVDEAAAGADGATGSEASTSTAGKPETLTEHQATLLGDLFAVVEEHAGGEAQEIDRAKVEHAFAFACERHADQRRASGDDFIVHPIGVAKICAGMRLDTATLCAALLHDTVEDTSASLEHVEEEFGEEVAALVDGVTKLAGITFQSRDDRQAENYRKMMVAMASDIRVILIKLADRLHNMRTLAAMPKVKQQEKAKETLEIFAPLAHRLGIHAIKWELEDLAFATLHPRKYNEIKGLVNQQREEREGYVTRAGDYLGKELEEVGIDAEISGRAKHFYSIYSKMTRKGREFNEIYDLTAMRVRVGSVKDCYGAIG